MYLQYLTPHSLMAQGWPLCHGCASRCLHCNERTDDHVIVNHRLKCLFERQFYVTESIPFNGFVSYCAVSFVKGVSP